MIKQEVARSPDRCVALVPSQAFHFPLMTLQTPDRCRLAPTTDTNLEFNDFTNCRSWTSLTLQLTKPTWLGNTNTSSKCLISFVWPKWPHNDQPCNSLYTGCPWQRLNSLITMEANLKTCQEGAECHPDLWALTKGQARVFTSFEWHWFCHRELQAFSNEEGIHHVGSVDTIPLWTKWECRQIKRD